MIEGKGLAQLLPPHDLEADRVDQREVLVGESEEPAVLCLAHECRGHIDPLVQWIIQQMRQCIPRAGCSAKGEEVRVELAKDQRRAEVATARSQVAFGQLYRASVMLILPSTQREERAGINEYPHAFSFGVFDTHPRTGRRRAAPRHPPGTGRPTP